MSADLKISNPSPVRRNHIWAKWVSMQCNRPKTSGSAPTRQRTHPLANPFLSTKSKQAAYSLLAKKNTFIYSTNNNKSRTSSFSTKQVVFFLLTSGFVHGEFWALPTCLEKAKALPIPTYKHPSKTSSAINHSMLPFNDSSRRNSLKKSFQLPHQQKWCFQESFSPNSPDKEDGSDQSQLFQHKGGSGQEGNVKAYRENTHTTSVWL